MIDTASAQIRFASHPKLSASLQGWGFCRLLGVTLAALIFLPETTFAQVHRFPLQAFAGQTNFLPSVRQITGRYNRDKARERDALINELRQLVSQADTIGKQAGSECARLADQLPAVKATFERASKIADENESALQASKRKLHDVEQLILDNQPSKSEYRNMAAKQAESEVALNKVVNRLLPNSSIGTQDSSEAGAPHLTLAEKLRLKENVEYQSAAKTVEAAKAQLSSVQRRLFSEDHRWAAAKTAIQNAQTQLKTSQINAKHAGRDLTALERQIANAGQVMQYAQQQSTLAALQLRQMNARP